MPSLECWSSIGVTLREAQEKKGLEPKRRLKWNPKTRIHFILRWWANQCGPFQKIKKKLWATHELINMNHTITMSHTIRAPPIRAGQKWWQTLLDIEVSCSQWEGSACNHEGSSFFLLSGVRGGIFWVFFFLFPICSHHVPNDVPNSTSVLSYTVLLFNSHIHKLKRQTIG